MKEERRKRAKYDEEVRTDIALNKQKLEFVEQAIVGLSEKVDGIVTRDEFGKHNDQDRWMFGIIITILIGTLVKMFFM